MTLVLIILLTLFVAATIQSATAWTAVDTRRTASVARWRGPYDDARRRPRVPWPRRSPTSRPRSSRPRPSFRPSGCNPLSLNSACFPAALHTDRPHSAPPHAYKRTFAFTRITRRHTYTHTNTRTQVQERGNDPPIFPRTRPPTIKSRVPCSNCYTVTRRHYHMVTAWLIGTRAVLAAGNYCQLRELSGNWAVWFMRL